MKKYSIYALMGAIALSGSVGFTSCSSSSDDVVINNPDFDPVTNTVKTTISLSINPNNGSSTRQAGSTVQSGGNFRGISNILSVPSVGDVTTSTSLAGKLSWGDIDAFTNSVNYKLYTNQQIVVGVDHFYFWGKATASQDDVDDYLAYGFTSDNLGEAATTTVGAIQVAPVAMASSTDITTSSDGNWKYQSDALASYLTSIANVTDATDDTKKWSTTINPSLKSMYNEFTRTGTATTTLYNAGSAESVRLLLTDLLNKLDGITDASVTNIKTAIKTAIETKATVTGTTSPYTVAWKTTGCEFVGFPTNLGLPEGSAEYMWDATAASFKYITDNTLGNNFTAVENYVFPNELYYLTKTPLRATSNATVTWPGTAANWAATTAPWSTETSWTTAVEANSKNIALTYNINYGSALLATNVKAGAETLYDNARQLDPDKTGDANAVNKAIVVNDGSADKNPFELTGVLVGAQPSAVGWNFLPVEGATYNKVVYDGVMNGTINVTTSYNATPNYTLLFDNYRDVTGDNLNVNVCLEFKNNMTTSFYGKDGVILPGQKFYIVGKLTVNGATNPFPAASSTDESLKAYIPNRVLRAFIQDYLTTANFVLNAGTAAGNGDGSLAKALTTIPDLRQSSQEIGLSVDLTWQTGLTFEDIVLGQ